MFAKFRKKTTAFVIGLSLCPAVMLCGNTQLTLEGFLEICIELGATKICRVKLILVKVGQK
jgi:hypothetical protein